MQKDGLVYLRIKARPGATKSEVRGIMADKTIKINIVAKAIHGRANQELVGFLARKFGLAKDNVKIISGAGEKLKLVKIISKIRF